GYAGLLSGLPEDIIQAHFASTKIPGIVSAPRTETLEDRDVVALEPSGFVKILYRKSSPHNAIFATDRCNSLCLMCSQPPKDVDDSERIHEHLRLVDLIDPDTKELGI